MLDVDALVAVHEHTADRCRRCFEEGREAVIRDDLREQTRTLARHHRQMHRTLTTCEACRVPIEITHDFTPGAYSGLAAALHESEARDD